MIQNKRLIKCNNNSKFIYEKPKAEKVLINTIIDVMGHILRLLCISYACSDRPSTSRHTNPYPDAPINSKGNAMEIS